MGYAIECVVDTVEVADYAGLQARVRPLPLRDTMQIGDPDPKAVLSAKVLSAVALDDVLRSHLHGVSKLSDSVIASEMVLGTKTAPVLVSHIALHDVLHAARVDARLYDGASIDDKLSGRTTQRGKMVDGITVDDTLRVATKAKLTSAASIRSVVLTVSTAGSKLTSGMHVADALHSVVHRGERLADSASTQSRVAGVLRGASRLVDQMAIEDMVEQAGLDEAWVTCLTLGAASYWRDLSPAAVAVMDGVLYLATPAGVFSMTGGGQVLQRIELPYTDGGSNYLKRASSVLTEGVPHDAEVDVSAGDKATPSTYKYRAVKYKTNESRVVIGRGLVGRYWALKAKFFEPTVVCSITSDAADVSRRV